MGDVIARIYGLEKGMAGKLLEFQNRTVYDFKFRNRKRGGGTYGSGKVQKGRSISITSKIAQVPVSDVFLGHDTL